MHLRGRDRRATPVLALTLLVAVTISVLGMVSGPWWGPAPGPRDIVPKQADPRITDEVGAAIERFPTGTFEITKREIMVDLGDVQLPAQLIEPVDAPEGPGMVFIHGAGTEKIGAFVPQVEGIASAGIRALVPAKNMETYSTRHRDYEGMARDYLRSWEALREQPGVDPDRVGMYGESEGAWIAPIVGVLEPRVDFVILASAPVVSPREQAAYAVATYMTNTNVPRGLFRSIPRALGADIPGGGFEYIDFDIRPFYSKLTQPVLMLYGTADPSMPTVQGVQITRDTLEEYGNTAFTARFITGADHGLKREKIVVPEVMEILSDWTWGLPGTAHPIDPIAGAHAHQPYSADPVPKAKWWASGNFLVYSVVGVLGVALVGLALTAFASVRGSALASRYAMATVLAALSTLCFFVAYLAEVGSLAVSYQTDDIVVRGGWALIQASGIFAVGVLAFSLREAYLTRYTLRPLARVGAWIAHLGTAGLLVLAAYWGLFPFSW